MVKEIIFDFDGTIADTFDFNISFFNKIKDEFGFENIDKSELKIFREKGFKQVMKDVGIRRWKLPKIIRRHQQLSNDQIDKTKFFPGMMGVLEKLKKEGLVLGLLSSNSRENVKKFLDKNNINYFDYVDGGSALFGKDKTIKNILKKRKLKKEDVVYIGDEIRDVEACKKAGVKVIAVTWGYNSRKALTEVKPDWLIKKPKEIISIILS